MLEMIWLKAVRTQWTSLDFLRLLWHISVAPCCLRFSSGDCFLEVQQATSCDRRPVTWRRPAVSTSEVTVDVGQPGQPGVEVTESGSHVRRAALASSILLHPPHSTPFTNPTPSCTAYATRARLQDQPGVVWSYPGDPQSSPQSHANRYQTPQQTHLQEFAHTGVSWWAHFKAGRCMSCVKLSDKMTCRHAKDSKNIPLLTVTVPDCKLVHPPAAMNIQCSQFFKLEDWLLFFPIYDISFMN